MSAAQLPAMRGLVAMAIAAGVFVSAGLVYAQSQIRQSNPRTGAALVVAWDDQSDSGLALHGCDIFRFPRPQLF